MKFSKLLPFEQLINRVKISLFEYTSSIIPTEVDFVPAHIWSGLPENNIFMFCKFPLSLVFIKDETTGLTNSENREFLFGNRA